MAELQVEIVSVGTEREIPLQDIVLLLNRTQSAFRFALLEHHNLISLGPGHGLSLTTQEVYALLEDFKAHLRGYHPYVIAVADRRLDGERFSNLFGSMKADTGKLTGMAITTLYGVEHLLGSIPAELYLGFEFLSFALRFLHGEGLIHDDRRECVFDRKVDKREIVDAMRTGNLCESCRSSLKTRLDLDQEFAVERVFRFIRDVANSHEPRKVLEFHLANAKGRMPKVFLCHSSCDKTFVHRLARDLLDSGCRVWFDAWEVGIGDNIVEKITAGIAESDYLGVVLSQASMASAWVRKEWTAMFMRLVDEKKARILPILIEETEVPLLLRPLKYANFCRPEIYDIAFRALIDTIRRNEVKAA